MSCKALINTALTAPTAVAVGGTIPVGTINHRYGRGLMLNGTGITIGACDEAAGYYKIDVSITVAPTAAGTVTATVLANGADIPAGTASETTTAAASSVNLAINTSYLQLRNGGGTTLTVVLTGAASTVTNMSVVVTKL